MELKVIVHPIYNAYFKTQVENYKVTIKVKDKIQKNMKKLVLVLFFMVIGLEITSFKKGNAAIVQEITVSLSKSIRDFGVLPGNDAATNTVNLQKAIDWATKYGASLLVDPTDEPYPINGGIILRRNVSLIGVNGPTGRGTTNFLKNAPVGSVFKIIDDKKPFITVESATQISGIHFGMLFRN